MLVGGAGGPAAPRHPPIRSVHGRDPFQWHVPDVGRSDLLMDNSEVLDIQELSDEMLAEIVGGSGLTINSCI
ncbi:hypothetical protein GCM10018954_037760 [Kutzneria kofuensis]